jgi:hypothetical protein
MSRGSQVGAQVGAQVGLWRFQSFVWQSFEQ